MAWENLVNARAARLVLYAVPAGVAARAVIDASGAEKRVIVGMNAIIAEIALSLRAKK